MCQEVGMTGIAVVVGLVVCFLATLWVGDRLVQTTGDTSGLRDLAELVRAFWGRFRK